VRERERQAGERWAETWGGDDVHKIMHRKKEEIHTSGVCVIVSLSWEKHIEEVLFVFSMCRLRYGRVTIIAVRIFENPNDTSFDAPPVPRRRHCCTPRTVPGGAGAPGRCVLCDKATVALAAAAAAVNGRVWYGGASNRSRSASDVEETASVFFVLKLCLLFF